MNLRSSIFNEKLPVQEQLIFCLLLTLIGGYYDAYTFVNCEGIFANAQTGNMIFIGLSIVNKEYHHVIHYLLPILSFFIGVIVCKFFEYKNSEISISRYLQLLFITQISTLLLIYFKYIFLGFDIRPLAISFICGIQFAGFRKINNLAFASVFCTGNLRSAGEHLFKYIILKQKNSLYAFWIYTSVILVFIGGVVLGAFVSKYFLHQAILLPILLLFVEIIFIKTLNTKP